MSHETTKCEVRGCKDEGSRCYYGSSSPTLCDNHDHALDSYYRCLAARDESCVADDKAEAILAAIHAANASVGGYVIAREDARVKEAIVDKYIESWIRDQGTEGCETTTKAQAQRAVEDSEIWTIARNQALREVKELVERKKRIIYPMGSPPREEVCDAHILQIELDEMINDHSDD